MTKTILGIGAVILLALGLMVWGAGTAATNSPGDTAGGGAASALVASATLYDFGTISMKNGTVEKVFTVTNPTDRDIRLANVSTSCMCTTAFIESAAGEKGPFGMPGHGGPSRPADELIGAGESRQVKVVYDPNAHGPAGVGTIDRFIYLVDEDGGTLALEIKALVTP